jgi:hypothetical protein
MIGAWYLSQIDISFLAETIQRRKTPFSPTSPSPLRGVWFRTAIFNH